MSGQAMEQDTSSAALATQTKPPNRVTADSFRSLTQRLKSTQAIPAITPHNAPIAPPQVQPIPAVEIAPPVEAVPEHLVPQAIEFEPVAPAPVPVEVNIPTETPAEAEKDQQLAEATQVFEAAARPQDMAPAVEVPPPIEAPVEAPIEAPAPVVVIAQSPAVEELPSEPPIEIEPPLAAPGINPDRISFVLGKSAPPSASLAGTLALPPILPAPEPPKPSPARPSLDLQIDVDQEVRRINAEVRRRKDADLETVSRMVMTPPSLEERAEYLEEATRLAAAEEAQAAMLAHEPAEDLEALAQEHLAKYARSEHHQDDDLQGISEPHSESEAQDPLELAVETAEAASQPSPEPEQNFMPEQNPVPDPALQLDEQLQHDASAVIANETGLQPQPLDVTHQVDAELDAGFPTTPVPAPLPIPLPVEALQPPARITPREEPQPRAIAQPAPVHEAVAKMSENQVADLARSLLDMMASGSNAGLPQERALASDTLLRILPRLPQRALVQLSERLSMMDNPPHLIVARILHDERLDVSGPLIENAVMIGERELQDLILSGNQDKIRLVARRRKLTRALTNEIVVHGSPSAHLTLVRNASAELSHDSFVALTQAAKSETDLLAPLCTRADLPAPQAFELFWQSPPQLRRYLLSRFLTDSETLTRILKITLATQGGEHAGDEIADPDKVNAAFAQLTTGNEANAVDMLVDLAKVSGETIQKIIEDRSGEPLVVLLKLLGIPRNALVDGLRDLQKSEFGTLDPARDVQELQVMFDTLSYNKSRILMTYWDWAVQKTGPYAPAN